MRRPASDGFRTRSPKPQMYESKLIPCSAKTKVRMGTRFHFILFRRLS